MLSLSLVGITVYSIGPVKAGNIFPSYQFFKSIMCYSLIDLCHDEQSSQYMWAHLGMTMTPRPLQLGM